MLIKSRVGSQWDQLDNYTFDYTNHEVGSKLNAFQY